MEMPIDVIFVRHGQSEANILQKAEKEERVHDFPDELRFRPDYQHRLTDKGIAQARIAGEWILEHITDGVPLENFFEGRYASNFVRARETAAYLGGAACTWRLHQMIHERDWGEYGMTPRAEHSTRFPHTYRLKEAAPLHARLDGGESLADSVAMRVNDHRQELKDKWSGKRTITVSHGETISVVRYVYESMLPEDFDAMEKDKTQRIGNCAILWYTRENPFDRNDVRPYLGWRRMIQPDDPKKSPFGGEWCELPDRRHMSGIELLNSAENFPRLTSQQNQAA